MGKNISQMSQDNSESEIYFEKGLEDLNLSGGGSDLERYHIGRIGKY